MAIATKPTAAEPAIERVQQTWADPKGLVGWFVTVQNGPIVNRYVFTTFVFFLLGGIEALLMRGQLAVPENDLLSPRQFNGLFTMHGSTMMFLFAVPILEAFANLALPLLLGARELPFPRMTAFGYWTYLFGGIFFYTAFLFNAVPDGGWFAYVPLTGPTYSPGLAIDFWLLGLSVAEVAALGAGIELTISILKLRAPGMSIDRLPLYGWAMLVTGFMMLFGFTPLLVSTTLLELDRLFHTQFFNPAGGGDPLLWQHLFWIFGHPDVYIMFIPATGIVSTIVATCARRPVASYTLVVLAIVATGAISFGLWVHHMFTAGLPLMGMTFFAGASMAIGIASGIQVFAWIATILRGRPVWNTPFLFVVGFLVNFVIGGLTGIMVAAVPLDWQVHDSYFVVAHFHYVLIGGVVFPIFAALHYWMPAMTGRKLGETLGRWTFWLVFIGFNVAFFPMHVSGLLGMPRRVYTYQAGLGWDSLNLLSTVGAVVLALGVLVFVWNVVRSLMLRAGRVARERPWGSGLLDEGQPLPASDVGWETIPIVRSRYPLWQQDGLERGDPRTVRLVDALRRAPDTWRGTVVTSLVHGEPEALVRLAGPSWWPLISGVMLTLVFVGTLFHNLPLTAFGFLGFAGGVIGWLWPAREERERRLAGDAPTLHGLPVYLSGAQAPGWWAMTFIVLVFAIFLALLVFSYFYLRARAPVWPPAGLELPGLWLPAANTVLLLASVGPLAWAEAGIRRGERTRLLYGLGAACGLGVAFLALQFVEYWRLGYAPHTHAYTSLYYALVGYQTLLVLGGVVMSGVVLLWGWLGYFNRWRFLAVQNTALYWYFLAACWLVVFAVVYVSPRVL